MFFVDIARICFSDCVKSFKESSMTAAEKECFDKCAAKSMFVHHLTTEPMSKLDQRFPDS